MPSPCTLFVPLGKLLCLLDKLFLGRKRIDVNNVASSRSRENLVMLVGMVKGVPSPQIKVGRTKQESTKKLVHTLCTGVRVYV